MSSILTIALLPLVATALIAGFRAPLRILLPAYAALVPFGSEFFSVPLGVPSRYSSLSSLVGLALTAALAFRVLTQSRDPRRLPYSVPVWLFLLALSGISALWSISGETTVRTFISFAGLVALLFLLALCPVDRQVVQRTEFALLIGALVACCYGITQAVTGTLPTEETGSPRFGSDLSGANHTAAMLLLPLAIALYRASAAVTLRGRVAGGATVAVLMAGILLTGSRGGLLAAAVTFVVVAVHGQRRTVVIGCGLIAAAAIALVFATTPGGVGQRQIGGDTSGRTEIWTVGRAACETYCTVGSGWGTFPEVYEQTQSSVADARVLRRGTSYEAHNIWLLVSVEAGVAGLVLLTVGLVLTLKEVLQLPFSVRGPPLAGLLGLLVTAVFLSNFEFKYFWLVLMYIVMNRNAAEQLQEPSPVLRRVVAVPLRAAELGRS